MDGAKENWNRGNAAQNKKYINPFRKQQQQQNKKSEKNKQHSDCDQHISNTNLSNRNSNPVNSNNASNAKLKCFAMHMPYMQDFREIQRIKAYRMAQLRPRKTEQKNQNLILKESVITIDSSDEENDDVIEIKLPSPPLVIVKDSSDESNDEDDNKFNTESETEKNIVTSSLPDMNVEDNHSNNSDDFIGNADRFRLTQSDEDMDEQEEHVMEHPLDLQNSNEDDQTHTNEIYQNNDNDDDNDDELFVSPQKKKKRMDSNLDDYQVTQTNFRALDVYESESSDMPESVYAKGRSKGPSRASCSSSDVEEIDDNEQEGQKTKRLRKRRVSSNKGSIEMSDKNADDDTDEDDVSDEGNEKTALPFISRGEAVDNNCKMKFSNKKLTKSSSDMNKSDENFINILKNISKGGQIEDDGNETDASNKSEDDDDDYDDETENITARKIVEDVINKNSSNQIVNDDNSNSVIDNQTENTNNIGMEYTFLNKIIKAEDNDDKNAIPEIDVNLSQVLNIIDKLDDDENEASINDDDNTNDDENETDDDNSENLNINENDENESDDEELMYIDDNVPQNLNNNEELETINTENYKQQNENENNSFMKITHSSSKTYIGWNDEMIRFYDRSWGDENLSVHQIRNTMYRNLNANSKWNICKRDRFQNRDQRRFSNKKCYNCYEFGHTKVRCPLPKKPIVCHMCGETDHKEPRCPNTICLRCGNKTRVFMTFCGSCSSQNRLICPICKIPGHSIEYCPDKWRRYHSTTIPNEYPNKNVVYKKQKFCCSCSGRGHLQENCRALQTTPYPPTSSEIKSHEKSYQDIEITYKLAPNVIAYNLFYEPDSSVNFCFSNGVNINKRNYYWRFLNAVGLNYILRRKIPEARTNNLKAIELCENDKNETSNRKIEENVSSDVNINKVEEEEEEKEEESIEKNISENDNKNVFEIEKNYIEGMNKNVDIDKFKSKSNNPLLRKVLQKNFEKLNKSITSMTSTSATAKLVTNETEFDKDKNNEEIDEEINVEEVIANEFSEENDSQDPTDEESNEQLQQMNETEMENVELEEDMIDNNEINNEEISPASNAEEDNVEENEYPIIIIDDDDENEDEDMYANKTKTVIVKSELSDENNISDTEIIDCDSIEYKETDDDFDDDEDEDEDDYDYNYDENEDEENILSEKNEQIELNLSNRSNNSDSAEPPPDFLMNIFIPKQTISSNNENDEKENEEGKQQDNENDVEKEISQLPDFIPFTTNENDDDDDDCNEDDSLNNSVGKGISHRLSGRSFDGDCTNFIPDKDMPGEAKIHLTNFHAKYLLTADGQKFLNEKCKIHNIEIKMSWTSQANYLIINGLPKDRSRFHKDLLVELANIADKSITRVEKHTRIPKNRLNAIKFLQKEILQLTKNLGKVYSLYTQYSTSKIPSSKHGNSKAIRKDRRLLNMILLGQQGLGAGRQHLMTLTNLLKTLQESNYVRIPDDMHLEIYNHWKFIFSSRIHENIHDLFKEYNRLKRQNQLIKFNVARVLGKNAIYVNFTRKHIEGGSGGGNRSDGGDGRDSSFDERYENENVLNSSNSNDNSNNNNRSLSSSKNIFDGKKNKVFNPFSLYQGLIPGINKKINNNGNKNIIEQMKQKNTNDEGKGMSFTDNLNVNLIPNSMTDMNSSTSDSSYCTDYADTDDTFNNNNNSASQLQQNNIFEINSPNILKKSTDRTDISSSPPPRGKLSLPSSMTSTPEKSLLSSSESLSLESSKPSSSRSLSLESSQPAANATAAETAKATFVSNKIIEIKKVWENQCENLLNKIGNNKRKNDNSIFWSRECIKFIDLCIEEPMLDAKFKNKLHVIIEKAKKGELSYNDCLMMSKIHNIIKARNI